MKCYFRGSHDTLGLSDGLILFSGPQQVLVLRWVAEAVRNDQLCRLHQREAYYNC